MKAEFKLYKEPLHDDFQLLIAPLWLTCDAKHKYLAHSHLGETGSKPLAITRDRNGLLERFGSACGFASVASQLKHQTGLIGSANFSSKAKPPTEQVMARNQSAE